MIVFATRNDDYANGWPNWTKHGSGLPTRRYFGARVRGDGSYRNDIC